MGNAQFFLCVLLEFFDGWITCIGRISWGSVVLWSMAFWGVKDKILDNYTSDIDFRYGGQMVTVAKMGRKSRTI